MIVLALCVLALVALPGCEAWQKMTGQPTQTQVNAAEQAYDEATKAQAASDKALAALKAEIAAAQQKATALDAQRDTLGALQARTAMELANASEEARPFIEAQLEAISLQRRSLTDARRAFAESLAARARDLAELEGAAATTREELEMRSLSLDDLKAQAVAGQEKSGQLVGALTSTIGTLFPPAAPFIGMASPYIGGLLALGGPVFGATTVIQSRRRKKAEEDEGEAQAERDAARRVLANTERFGFDAITNDASVRQLAKATLSADPAASLELARVKAGIVPIAAPSGGVPTKVGAPVAP